MCRVAVYQIAYDWLSPLRKVDDAGSRKLVAAMKRPSSTRSMKRPSAASAGPHRKACEKDLEKLKAYTFPLHECPACGKGMYIRKDKAVRAILVGGESITDVKTYPKICHTCRHTTRYNLLTIGKETLNCLSYDAMKQCGALFVSSKTGFSFPYLEMTYLRLLRGKLSPGQETAVQHIYHEQDEGLPTCRRMREMLFHALEAYAVAKRTPSNALQFHLNYPASYVTKVGKVITFPCSEEVSAVSFDGHFGVHRKLSKWDPPRTVKLKGHPRSMKILRDDERSCSCKKKDATRVVLPQRTAGWHFAVDPSSRRVLGAVEHVQNECNSDKVALIKTVMKMKNVHVDLLIHDDMCHFEPHAKKHHGHAFSCVRHWVVDAFHCPNHTCSKQAWTAAEKRRCKDVRTNVSESFNAWVRGLNFFMNGLRPLSHRFWMEELCTFYNEHLQSVPLRISRRTNVLGRARKVLKRPSSRILKRPSAVRQG